MSALSSAPNVQLAPPHDAVFVLSQQAVEGASKREMLTKERAEALLHPLLQKPPSKQATELQRLVLGGKSFGSDSAPVVAAALQHTPALRHADFADCIAGRNTDEALDTLEKLCDAIGANEAIQLTHLNLSDNALGVRGIPKIRNAFRRQRSLQHLYLNNDGLEAKAVTALTDIIMENYEADASTQLRTLEIGHNCMEDAGFTALIPLVRASPLLQTLRIATTRVRNNTGAGLAMSRTLLGLHHLTSLSLNDNNLGREAGAVLGQVILQNRAHLSFLNLGDIGVEQDGISDVLKAVTKIKPGVLTHLDLSANELSTPTHAARLVAIVRAQAASLQHLKLEDNELRSGGASKLLRALTACKALTYLNLTNNHMGDRCAPELLAFLEASPQLKEVHLNGNRFSEETLEKIKAAVAAHADAAGAQAALGTLSDNDADEEESEEDDAEVEEDEEEEGEKADADVDALAAGLAATSVKE